ncbi:hypothetical protein MMC11_003671 [Xylographa trunciseda]|nr:hypothetical protein [Xylographa trunciseda]
MNDVLEVVASQNDDIGNEAGIGTNVLKQALQVLSSSISLSILVKGTKNLAIPESPHSRNIKAVLLLKPRGPEGKEDVWDGEGYVANYKKGHEHNDRTEQVTLDIEKHGYRVTNNWQKFGFARSKQEASDDSPVKSLGYYHASSIERESRRGRAVTLCKPHISCQATRDLAS